jgi:phage-related protein
MPDTNLGTATGYLNLDIQNWNNALDDARESLREFENSSSSMGDTLRNTQQATNGVSDALRSTSDSASRARSAFDSVRQVTSSTSNAFDDITSSASRTRSEFSRTTREAQRFERQMQRLEYELGGEVPQATRDAYQEMYRLRSEMRNARRYYGSYSREAMEARNAMTEFALSLDDNTFRQIYMRGQLGLTERQLQTQANSIRLNARMTSLMGDQTQILTQRMQGLQDHGIRPEMLLPPSTPGQFRLLSEAMDLGVSPLNRLSSGYRRLGGRVEGVIKKYSAQKVAVRAAQGSMVRYGLIMRNLTTGTANLGLAIPIVGAAAIAAYGVLFSAAMKADEGLQKLWDTTKNKLAKAFEPLIETAGQVLEVGMKVVGVIADWIAKFNEAHPIIAKVASVVALLAPAMTLLLLPLSMGVGLWSGWLVALNGAWTMIGGVVAMIGTATSTFFAFAIPIAAVTAGLIHLYKTNETFRTTVNNAWQSVKEKAADVFGTLEKYFTETIPNAYKKGGIKGVLDQFADTFKSGLDKVKSSLPQWLENGKSMASNLAQGINQGLPALQAKASEMISNLVAGVLKVAPKLIETAGQLIQAWLKMWSNNVTLFLDAGFKLLEMIMQGIAQALPVLIETIVNVISTVINIIAENLPKIIEAGVYIITALVNGISQNLPAIVDIITNTLSSIVNIILENLPLIIEAAAQIITTLAVALIENLPILLEAAVKLVIEIARCILENLPLIIEAGIQLVIALGQAIIQALPQIVAAIGELFIGILEVIAEEIGKLGQFLLDKAMEIVPQIQSKISELWEQIKITVTEKATELWNSITQWANSVYSSASSWISNLISSIGTWLSGLPGKVGYALGFVLGAITSWGINTYNYFATNIPMWINSIGNWFSQLPSKIGKWLTDTYSRVTQWGSNMLSKAQETGSRFISNTINWFQQLPGKVWNFLSNTYSKATQWASQMIAKAQQAGSQFVSKVGSALSTLPGRVWSFLSSCISKAISFASQFGAQGQKAANDFKNKIINGVNSIPGKMASIGKQIVQGIWRGISGAGSWLRTQISNFASGVVKGFKAGFKINSPSKIMRDIIGVGIVEGIGVGIDQEENSLLGKAKNLANSVVGVMNNNATTMDLIGTAKGLTGNIGAVTQTTQNNTSNAINININNPCINDKIDIETLANDLAFYLKRKKVLTV